MNKSRRKPLPLEPHRLLAVYENGVSISGLAKKHRTHERRIVLLLEQARADLGRSSNDHDEIALSSISIRSLNGLREAGYRRWSQFRGRVRSTITKEITRSLHLGKGCSEEVIAILLTRGIIYDDRFGIAFTSDQMHFLLTEAERIGVSVQEAVRRIINEHREYHQRLFEDPALDVLPLADMRVLLMPEAARAVVVKHREQRAEKAPKK